MFRLWNGSGDEVLDRLRHGIADLALVAAPYNTEHLDGFAVSREPWVAILSKNHPLAKEEGDFLPLAKLAGQPLIIPSRHSRIDAIRTWFEEIGAEPNVICELSNYVDAVALAEQNVGICIFPMTTYTKNELLVKKIITDSPRQIEYALVWNKNEHQTALVQEFINYVMDCREEERLGRQPYRMPENEYFPPEDTKYL
jgi:DNA-binding transcriptional LysR family regulator